jgi:hypothetical protein
MIMILHNQPFIAFKSKNVKYVPHQKSLTVEMSKKGPDPETFPYECSGWARLCFFSGTFGVRKCSHHSQANIDGPDQIPINPQK